MVDESSNFLYIALANRVQRKGVILMDSGIKAKLEPRFSDGKLTEIESFLDRGFSWNGQFTISSVLLFADDAGKLAAEVLAACEVEWERNWQFQHPDIKGDPDAPGGAGVQNRASLQTIYSALDLISPLSVKGQEIPRAATVVRTSNSVYRFGEADDKGERTVSRDESPLGFTRCKIVLLAVNERMELECLDGPDAPWSTTSVSSIE